MQSTHVKALDSVGVVLLLRTRHLLFNAIEYASTCRFRELRTDYAVWDMLCMIQWFNALYRIIAAIHENKISQSQQSHGREHATSLKTAHHKISQPKSHTA